MIIFKSISLMTNSLSSSRTASSPIASTYYPFPFHQPCPQTTESKAFLILLNGQVDAAENTSQGCVLLSTGQSTWFHWQMKQFSPGVEPVGLLWYPDCTIKCNYWLWEISLQFKYWLQLILVNTFSRGSTEMTLRLFVKHHHQVKFSSS